jgi:hypothetical protein
MPPNDPRKDSDPTRYSAGLQAYDAVTAGYLQTAVTRREYEAIRHSGMEEVAEVRSALGLTAASRQSHRNAGWEPSPEAQRDALHTMRRRAAAPPAPPPSRTVRPVFRNPSTLPTPVTSAERSTLSENRRRTDPQQAPGMNKSTDAGHQQGPGRPGPGPQSFGGVGGPGGNPSAPDNGGKKVRR